jgi:hypothetical protein
MGSHQLLTINQLKALRWNLQDSGHYTAFIESRDNDERYCVRSDKSSNKV